MLPAQHQTPHRVSRSWLTCCLSGLKNQKRVETGADQTGAERSVKVTLKAKCLNSVSRMSSNFNEVQTLL